MIFLRVLWNFFIENVIEGVIISYKSRKLDNFIFLILDRFDYF